MPILILDKVSNAELIDIINKCKLELRKRGLEYEED